MHLVTHSEVSRCIMPDFTAPGSVCGLQLYMFFFPPLSLLLSLSLSVSLLRLGPAAPHVVSYHQATPLARVDISSSEAIQDGRETWQERRGWTVGLDSLQKSSLSYFIIFLGSYSNELGQSCHL